MGKELIEIKIETEMIIGMLQGRCLHFALQNVDVKLYPATKGKFLTEVQIKEIMHSADTRAALLEILMGG